jgi:hypothetical protein
MIIKDFEILYRRILYLIDVLPKLLIIFTGKQKLFKHLLHGNDF